MVNGTILTKGAKMNLTNIGTTVVAFVLASIVLLPIALIKYIFWG